jgi:hypothetical protein
VSKPGRPKLPWDEVPLSNTELASIKAVHDGVANPDQQRIAFRTIVDKLCNVRGLSFAAGGEEGRRATDFSEGKRWVGATLQNQIVNRPWPVNPRGAPPPMPDEPAETAAAAVPESSQQGET